MAEGPKASSLVFIYERTLMKGLEAAKPAPATDERVSKIADEVRVACTKQSTDAVSAAQKDADEKAAAAKLAIDKLAIPESDPNKRATEKDASDKADVAAKDAAAKAAALNSAAQQKYVTMRYYLDSQFVTKPDTKEPWIRLLERPWQSGGAVTVSVGPVDGSPRPSTLMAATAEQSSPTAADITLAFVKRQ